MMLPFVHCTALRLRDPQFRPCFGAAGRASVWIHNIAIYLAGRSAEAGREDWLSLSRDTADARSGSCASCQEL